MNPYDATTWPAWAIALLDRIADLPTTSEEYDR